MNQLLDPEAMMTSALLGPDICVEFFGLPGSGKSTIARAAHASLSKIDPDMAFSPALLRDGAGVSVRVAAKLRLILAEIFGNRAILDLTRRALVTPQPSLRDRLRTTFTVATVAALYSSRRRHRQGAVLDQGLLQAIWSVQLRRPIANGGDLVSDMIKSAAQSRRIYVLVETPAEICAKRLVTRGPKHSRMQTGEGTRDLHNWEKAELLRRTILSDFRAACRLSGDLPHIVVIDGMADPALSAAQIVTAFTQYRLLQVYHDNMQNQGLKL